MLTSPLIIGTLIEEYEIDGVPIFVKREDLCCPLPGPPFSKMRGLYSRMKSLKESGVETVGYMETSVSMAGWGISYCASLLKMKAVIYEPTYKDGIKRGLLPLHSRKWVELGAEVRPIKAQILKVNHYMAKKALSEEFGEDAYMLELHLLSKEAVEENAAEWRRTDTARFRTVVINVGSGTICSGLIRGCFPDRTKLFVGVTCATKNVAHLEADISSKAGVPINGLVGLPLTVVDAGYEYTVPVDVGCPFPSHRYYDRKAWDWLTKNVRDLKPPILFWNIGAEVEEN
jgi:hypothetical protein